MKFIKRSTRTSSRVSLVLLDWSVRESFHLLHYLSKQTVPRDAFEVIIVEYYSRISEPLKKFEDQVDSWIVLEMPESCYYHKHLMYNVGIAAATGDIIMIGDSDAMVKPTFIETIIRNFDQDPKIVYHLDQFRNLRRDFYPFNYPSFEEVLGEGCVNNVGGKTAGVLNTEDPIHSRNYGACMCAKREDLIAIGGADMHIDYLGHICGPYDMTFRLINYGRREIWDMDEFMFHTWHPGQAGVDNYLGPHDGRHMSTTSLESLTSGRISPLAENEAIRLLRTGEAHAADEVLDKLIPPHAGTDWDLEHVEANASHMRWTEYKVPLGIYKGFRIVSEQLGRIFAYPVAERLSELDDKSQKPVFEGQTEAAIKDKIDAATSTDLKIIDVVAALYMLPFRARRSIYARAQRLPLPLTPRGKAILGALLAPLALLLVILFLPAPLIGKLRRLRRGGSLRPDHLGQLAITISNIRRWGKLAADGTTPVLIMAARESIYFIKLLQGLGFLPPMRLAWVTNAQSAAATLEQLEAEGWTGQLVVSTEQFSTFRAVIGAAPAANRLILV
jgi:Glycosyl transferase family 2